ncbi:MAG: class I SAM-dependent methyltransferase [Proteobacteria bacterium]|jgi:2-polyprenyl-3-methyl-5-hydroxy-6-metoxy-1,4-benzoquinol methylase|nr:class I SAM-dependent methyltransferase [Pseudomonadota bacterium]
MSWYDNFFDNEAWLDLHRHIYTSEQSNKTAEGLAELLQLMPGSRILDVPCGFGRIAIALARMGMEVVAVDFVQKMLDEGAKQADADQLSVTWQQMDMRQIAFDNQFEAVVNIWGSFGYFSDDANEAFAARVFRALSPGGHFVIDTPTAELLFAIWQDRGWQEVNGVKVLEERSFNPYTSRVVDKWTFIGEEGVSSHTSDMRIYTCAELTAMLKRVGFAEVTAYGSFEGDDFAIRGRRATEADSRRRFPVLESRPTEPGDPGANCIGKRMIMVARKG